MGETGRRDADREVVEVVRLADALRRAGVQIGTGQVAACQQALDELGANRSGARQAAGATQADRYWAGRLTLVTDPDDLATYDRVFRWLANVGLDGGDGTAPPTPPTPEAPVERGVDPAPDTDQPAPGGEDHLEIGAVASERERLRHRRFDRASVEELAEIDRLLHRLHVAVPHRAVRRTRPGRRGELDLPRTLERAMATDGELIDRAWRQRRTRPRRLVVLLDVSGSMAAHARALLRFAVAARRTADREASHRVEVFAFATRLTHLSDALAARDPDAAIAAAADRVVDWDGGTRIGACVDELVRTWARRGVLRGAVVVMCSDGLERGDPALLGSALARLRRHAHRLVWVNPLAGDARFEPSQRGMAAAMPYVDELVSGHDLASLEELSDILAGLR